MENLTYQQYKNELLISQWKEYETGLKSIFSNFIYSEIFSRIETAIQKGYTIEEITVYFMDNFSSSELAMCIKYLFINQTKERKVK